MHKKLLLQLQIVLLSIQHNTVQLPSHTNLLPQYIKINNKYNYLYVTKYYYLYYNLFLLMIYTNKDMQMYRKD
jgi:hypothetical protein